MNVLYYRLLFGTLLVISAIMPAPLLAAEEETQQLRNLLEELKSEIERAEQQGLADPWFLRDLRDLVSSYENPWRNEILYDNFSTRERKPSEPWQISAGEFLIDWRHGLRSVVETTRQEAQRQGDEMEQLFGALLNEALGNGENSQESATDPDYAAILAPVPISNAFSITINLNSRAMENAGGTFEWGLSRARTPPGVTDLSIRRTRRPACRHCPCAKSLHAALPRWKYTTSRLIFRMARITALAGRVTQTGK